MQNNNKNNKKKNNKSFSIALTYFIIALSFLIAFNYSKGAITTKDISYD